MCAAPCHPWHRGISPSRHLAIHGGALTSNVLFESWTSPVAVLNTKSSALIDAIPLKRSLSRETSSGFGVDGDWYDGRSGAVCVVDAKALGWMKAGKSEGRGDGSWLHLAASCRLELVQFEPLSLFALLTQTIWWDAKMVNVHRLMQICRWSNLVG